MLLIPILVLFILFEFVFFGLFCDRLLVAGDIADVEHYGVLLLEIVSSYLLHSFLDLLLVPLYCILAC